MSTAIIEERAQHFNTWLEDLEPDAQHALISERREVRRRELTKMMELSWTAGMQAAFNIVKNTNLDGRIHHGM